MLTEDELVVEIRCCGDREVPEAMHTVDQIQVHPHTGLNAYTIALRSVEDQNGDYYQITGVISKQIMESGSDPTFLLKLGRMWRSYGRAAADVFG